ncbi:MAG: hypothetical protein H7336_00390 [Bacteriovorax sp.]|nr:hypothetical protein [Bacteriovorax sp.]
MNVDTKLPQFKNFMNNNMLNGSGIKTAIDQSAVTAGENANVDLNLSGEDGQGNDKKSKKKKKEKLDSLEKNKNEGAAAVKSDHEVKALNVKLLNLL